jgi:hypothetical protein
MTTEPAVSTAKKEFIDRLISDPKETNRSPIEGYQDMLILTLEEAVERIIPIIPQVVDYVLHAKQECNRNSIHLTLDESAAIYLFTMPTKFFEALNNALRIENRHKLKPWFAFLKLFITALEKLPSVSGTFWRGVPCDVVSEYTDHSVQIWWSVNSCSTHLNVVEFFLNTKGGTLFSIQATEGKNISTYSAFQSEQEVILMPGIHLRVKSKMANFVNVLSIIHLEEQKLESTKNFLRSVYEKELISNK